MGQSGQYNYPRSINRQDYQATYLACVEFVQNTMNAIYVLNEEYKPFYKWSGGAVKNLYWFSFKFCVNSKK